jgi:pyruvyltransferase
MLTRIARRAKIETTLTASRIFDARRAGLGRMLPAFWYTAEINFGDVLAPVILERVHGVRPVLAPRNRAGKVLGIGSILHHSCPGDVIWGSGALEKRPHDGRDRRFLAVRGPMTRNLVNGDVPEVYGDPAQLLPIVYEPRALERRFDIGVVAHYLERDTMFVNDPNVASIDVRTDDWQGVVDQIISCDVIVSSSLHGIIVAETYGIPAVWVQPTTRLKGGRFKFDDYYAATERRTDPVEWAGPLSSLVATAKPPPFLDPRPLLDAWPWNT